MWKFSKTQVALLSILVIFAVSFLYETMAPAPEIVIPNVAEIQKDRPLEESRPAKVLNVVLDQEYKDLSERPPFSPTRRPIVIAKPKVVSAPPPPPNFTLVGIVYDGDNSLAILRVPGGLRALSVHVGKVIDGWEIEKIEVDRVSIRSGDATQEVRLPNANLDMLPR